MAEQPTFHIGTVSGGQNNFGGHHNRFVQEVRGRLNDFTDPDAAARDLAILEQAPDEARAQPVLERMLGYVRPGTEALTALIALVAAARGA